MSHRPASFDPDYDHQTRWRDDNVAQGHPSDPVWQASANHSNTHHRGVGYYNSSPAAWTGSHAIVNNEPVWGSSPQYRAAGTPGQHIYASKNHHENGVHRAQYRDDQNAHFVHDADPEVPDHYGHRGDIVASPIDDHYQYPTHVHSSESPTSAHGWVADPHLSSRVVCTEVDEYRASIARRCDAIHASGSHGLESDNDTAHVHIYYGRLPHEEEEPERSSEQHYTHNEWSSPIATATYNSLVRNAYPGHVIPNSVEEPLMEPPMRVPSQQHLVDCMNSHRQHNQRSHSPVIHYQRRQGSPVNRQPSASPSSDEADFALPLNSPYKRPLISTLATSSSPRQGLEHEAASDLSPDGLDRSSPPTPSLGSSQSVLKLTMTKKVAEKKQALACLFCRERKIACGRPGPDNEDQTCNQCARRNINCEYPKESRRGQHRRTRRKKTHDQDVNESSPLSGY